MTSALKVNGLTSMAKKRTTNAFLKKNKIIFMNMRKVHSSKVF